MSTPAGLSLPPGRSIDLPGRGTTFIRELPGPPGAPTVVLLHGWTVSADLNWFACYRPLAQHFRVVAIDHRGHGRGIRSRRHFRLSDCADDVAVLCQVLGIERCIPVGYSMGGPIAMLTWHRHRALVDGLVLCATAPFFRATGSEATLFTMLPLLSTTARLTPMALRRRVLARVLEGRHDETDLGLWARQEIARADPLKIAEAGTALGRFDARPWLGDIDVPVAVLRTTRDRAVSPVRQTVLGDNIPGARTIDVVADHAACVIGWRSFVPALVRGARHVASSPRPTPTAGGSPGR